MADKTMSWQERIWNGGCVFWFSVKPFLLYLFLPAIISGLAAKLTKSDQQMDSFLWRSGVFYKTVGIGFTFYLLSRACKKRGVTIWDETTCYWRQAKPGKMILLAGAGMGCSLFISAMLTVFPFPQFLIGSYRDLSSQLYTRVDIVLSMVSVTLLAPVVEEIVFRGYMLNRMLQGYGQTKTAVLTCTLVFALCHATPLWMFYALFMGLIMAHISMVEDNIAYSIAFHIGYNLVTLPIWLISQNPETEALFFASPVLVGCYGGIGIMAACLCFRRYALNLGQLKEYLPRWGKTEGEGANEPTGNQPAN